MAVFLHDYYGRRLGKRAILLLYQRNWTHEYCVYHWCSCGMFVRGICFRLFCLLYGVSSERYQGARAPTVPDASYSSNQFSWNVYLRHRNPSPVALGPSYIGLGIIGFGWGCAGDFSLSYLMDCYPKMVLEGMVGVSIINNSMACLYPFFCEKWIKSQGIFDTYIAIGSLNLLFFCSSIPMIIWGKKCRKKTKNLYVNFFYLRDRH